METFWPIAVFVVILVAVVVVGSIAAAKRRKELLAFAERTGLTHESDCDDVHERYGSFAPFGRGHSQRSSNLLHGQRGEIAWQLFDYRYTTGSGKNKRTYRHGIAAAALPVLFHRLTLRPEGLFDWVASMAGFDDINFESEQFSRKYHVSCEQRKFAYDLIHPQMIEYLLTCTARHWQLGGNVILLHKSGHFSAEEMEDAMAMVEGFVQRIPAYVRQDSHLEQPRL